MKVLAATSTFDIGGQGIRLKEAFERYGDGWALRSVAQTGSYLAYPPDLPYRRRLLEEQYQECDVFHARLDFALYDQLAAKFGPKPVVLHVHGTKYRANPHRFVREARQRGALILCSTLDLYLLGPEDSVWLAAPYNVDSLMEIRRAERPELQPRS